LDSGKWGHVASLLKQDRIAASVGLVLSLLIAQRVVSFVRGIAFARLLGTEQYGIYTLGFFLILITVSLTSLGIPSSFGRYTPRYQAMSALRWFFRKTYVLNVTVSIAVGAVIFLMPSFFSRLVYGDASHAGVMMVVGLAVPALVVLKNFISTFSGLKLFRASSFLEFSQVAIYAVLGIALVSQYRLATVGLLAYAVSLFIIVPLFVPLLSKYLLSQEPSLTRPDETGFYRRLLRFTIWFTVTPILVHIFHYVDRLSLQRLMTSSDQGIYSAAINLSATISAVGLAVNNVIYPHLSTSWEKGDKSGALGSLDLAIRVTALALVVVGVILVVLGKPIILLLLGQEYVHGAAVLPYLVVFYLYTISVWLFGVYPSLVERTYVSAIGLACALPVNVALNLVLIPRFGIVGAGLATMASYFLMWCIVVAICGRFGLPLRPKTLIISLSPFLLLLPAPAALIAVGLLTYAGLTRTWILSADERGKVYAEVGGILKRLKVKGGGKT
jgi:O-antigen/teichoic acid export membrane protein